MALTVIQAHAARRIETPTGVMTTLASPTQGGSARLSLWRVEMPAGRQGPLHSFDSEQVWSVAEGVMAINAGGEVVELRVGDTVVVPRGVERQITAVETTTAVVCGFGDAVVSVPGKAAARATPAWIA
jgi:quercetin dioxygenase-like cupin family protein